MKQQVQRPNSRVTLVILTVSKEAGDLKQSEHERMIQKMTSGVVCRNLWDFKFYSDWDEKLWKSFEQKNNVSWLFTILSFTLRKDQQEKCHVAEQARKTIIYQRKRRWWLRVKWLRYNQILDEFYLLLDWIWGVKERWL